MISKIVYNFRKIKFDELLVSCTQTSQYTYPRVTVFGNTVATKKFSIKSLSEMANSSVKNPGKVEYDKQNCLQYQKTLAWPKSFILFVFSIVQLTIALVQKFVFNEKMLPIKILLEMIDSSIKNCGEVEYDKQNCLQLQKIEVWWALGESHPNFTVHLSESDNIWKSRCHKKVLN